MHGFDGRLRPNFTANFVAARLAETENRGPGGGHWRVLGWMKAESQHRHRLRQIINAAAVEPIEGYDIDVGTVPR
jgi:hypothetical protein